MTLLLWILVMFYYTITLHLVVTGIVPPIVNNVVQRHHHQISHSATVAAVREALQHVKPIKIVSRRIIKRQITSSPPDQNEFTTIAEIAEFVQPEDGEHTAPSLEITYRISKSSKNTPSDVIERTLRKAFDKWEEKADVAFVPKQDNDNDGAPADINIAFEDGEHGDKQAFDGTGGIAAHAIKTKRNVPSNPEISTTVQPRQELHFDDGDDWTEDSLLRIACAEIGKLLQMQKQQQTDAVNDDGQVINEQLTTINNNYYDNGLNPSYYSPYYGDPYYSQQPFQQSPFYSPYQTNFYGSPNYYSPYLQNSYYGSGLGRRQVFDIDTFYWSDYDSTSNWEETNQNVIESVQELYGTANKGWLNARQRLREKFGNNYSPRNHQRGRYGHRGSHQNRNHNHNRHRGQTPARHHQNYHQGLGQRNNIHRGSFPGGASQHRFGGGNFGNHHSGFNQFNRGGSERFGQGGGGHFGGFGNNRGGFGQRGEGVFGGRRGGGLFGGRRGLFGRRRGLGRLFRRG